MTNSGYILSGTCSVTNTNVYCQTSSYRYDIGPNGTPSGAVVSETHVADRYLYATGCSLTYTQVSGRIIEFTKTIPGQQGASILSSNLTLTGNYSYGDGESGDEDTHIYPTRDSVTATYSLKNDLQDTGLSGSTTIVFVSDSRDQHTDSLIIHGMGADGLPVPSTSVSHRESVQ